MVFLLHLFGAVALLLWGLRMVRTGILRAYGTQLRHFLSNSMSNRFSAMGTGFVVALLLQSSSATGLVASSFASRGLFSTSAALAIMLGADIGTSFVAQAYTLPLQWLSPLAILIGWIMFHKIQNTQLKDLGRAVVGLGIALLALELLTAAAAPIRDAQLLPEIMQTMQSAPIFGVILGAVLTVLSTSSLAIVLLVASFVTMQLVPIDLGLAMVLGANLGSDIMPIMANWSQPAEARRVPFGNMTFRLSSVIIALPLIPHVQPYLAEFQSDGLRQTLNFHVVFNLAMAVCGIWLVGPVSRLMTQLLPQQARADDPSTPHYLNEGSLESPPDALANAAREALRMGDLLGQMLTMSLNVFRSDDRKLIKDVAALDNHIDRLNEAIKLYLTRINRDIMNERDHRRVIDLISFITNLEHIGDILDKSLMELAAKKVKYSLKFSEEGAQEIEEIHQRLNENLELAMNVFMSSDLSMARRLFAEKQIFRELEKTAAENHLERLRSGRIESIATSGLHLDILRDLKRINSHLALVAQPILELAGELSPSRLR
ncbi:MAG: Na/Pi cotransporter family protein [Rhodospirillaceae bacterium]|nr:MAG: Na/Pi cotransporter family protein [Rhodospirillaceae bacterium]